MEEMSSGALFRFQPQFSRIFFVGQRQGVLRAVMSARRIAAQKQPVGVDFGVLFREFPDMGDRLVYLSEGGGEFVFRRQCVIDGDPRVSPGADHRHEDLRSLFHAGDETASVDPEKHGQGMRLIFCGRQV